MHQKSITIVGFFFAVACGVCAPWAMADYQPVAPVAGAMPAAAVALIETTSVPTAKFDRNFSWLDYDLANPLQGTMRQRAVDEVMNALITDQWVRLESAQLGIVVTDGELLARYRRLKRQTFPTERSFREFLRNTMQTESDLIDTLRGTMLRGRLQGSWTAGVAVSDAEIARVFRTYRKRYLRRYRSAAHAKRAIARKLLQRKRKAKVDAGLASLRARWKPATMCRPGYESKVCGIVSV